MPFVNRRKGTSSRTVSGKFKVTLSSFSTRANKFAIRIKIFLLILMFSESYSADKLWNDEKTGTSSPV